MSDKALDKAQVGGCLNPCCNGIYSMSCVTMMMLLLQSVLILVVMEYTQ